MWALAARIFLLVLNFWRWPIISKEHMINEEIRAKEVRVVGANGEQIGVVSLREALQLAMDANMDLVNVAPTAKPPVCRIMDYGKFRFEQSKKEKEARKNQKIINIKEIRFSPTIEDHDLNFKARNAQKFLQDGDKVKVTIRFRGREVDHVTFGEKALGRFYDIVKDHCVVEKPAKLEGKNMTMVLAPKQ